MCFASRLMWLNMFVNGLIGLVLSLFGKFEWVCCTVLVFLNHPINDNS